MYRMVTISPVYTHRVYIHIVNWIGIVRYKWLTTFNHILMWVTQTQFPNQLAHLHAL